MIANTSGLLASQVLLTAARAFKIRLQMHAIIKQLEEGSVAAPCGVAKRVRSRGKCIADSDTVLVELGRGDRFHPLLHCLDAKLLTRDRCQNIAIQRAPAAPQVERQLAPRAPCDDGKLLLHLNTTEAK